MNIPAGWTPIDIQAEYAPIGVQLWPTRDAKYAPNYTLVEVQVRRDASRSWVVWVYENSNERMFPLGEMVASVVRESDVDKIRPLQLRLDLTTDEADAVVAVLADGASPGTDGHASWADRELAGDIRERLRKL